VADARSLDHTRTRDAVLCLAVLSCIILCGAHVLQVLKTPQRTLVSSIFFMCLPDKVLCVPLFIYPQLPAASAEQAARMPLPAIPACQAFACCCASDSGM
jgi:phosphotransacetylase